MFFIETKVNINLSSRFFLPKNGRTILFPHGNDNAKGGREVEL